MKQVRMDNGMDDDVSPVWCSSLCEMTACLVSSISIFF